MHDEPDNAFLCGVIEGFYGRPWPFDVRLAYAGYLSSAGLNTCLYCPKSDPFLRRRWRERWPDERWRELEELAQAYRTAGVAWGPGLSPYELYRGYGAGSRSQLRSKIDSIAQLGAPLLAVLFDDMPGDYDALAEQQAEIVTDIATWLPGTRLLVCPTYYSFDPVLEHHFGAMPADYWPKLGRSLPAEVDVFWTGNRVCSEAIMPRDIEAISGQLGRRVLLWDNYPVNDGAVRSNYLYTRAPENRSPALRALVTGHLCNGMNQALLTLPALLGLARLYGLDRTAPGYLAGIIGVELFTLLQRDGALFQEAGLQGLPDTRRRELAAEYAALPGVAAGEVAGWLRGEYRFDPDCLTD